MLTVYLCCGASPLGFRFMIIFGFYRVKQKGRRCKASEAAVIVPNHVSFIEPLYLGGVHMLSAVSRAENGKMPLIGRGLMALQCILVGTWVSLGKPRPTVRVRPTRLHMAWLHDNAGPLQTASTPSLARTPKTPSHVAQSRVRVGVSS